MQITLEIKHIFLSFLQQYYATEHPELVWNVDPRKTKIFIADKYALAPAIIEKTPSIIFSRGFMTWAQTSIDQMFKENPFNSTGDKVRTDLVRCSATFQCVSKSGIEAEDLAGTLFGLLVGYKDQLRSHGIHQILNVAYGEEQVVRGDVEPRLVSVPININFTVQRYLLTTQESYGIDVTTSEDFVPQLNQDMGVIIDDWYGYTVVSGQTLVFTEPPPSGTVFDVTYKGAITYNTYTHVIPAGICDGINNIFTLPEPVYCMYKPLNGLIFDNTLTIA